MSKTQQLADRIQESYDAWANGTTTSPSESDFVLFAMEINEVKHESQFSHIFVSELAQELYEDTARDQMDAFEIAEWLMSALEEVLSV